MPHHPHTTAWSGSTPGIADEDRLTENLAAPAIRHAAFRRRLQLRLLKVNVLLIPVLMLLTVITVVGQGVQQPAAGSPASSIETNSSPGKAAALLTLEGWLSDQPAPVPGGKIVGWDGYSSKKIPVSRSTAGGRSEIHRFTIASVSDATSTLYDSSVEVRITSDRIATVVGQPTLIPRLSAGTGSGGGSASTTELWPGWESAATGESINSAVDAWATAFTSGDPAALRLAVGDKSKSRGYVPLTGARATNVTVSSLASKPLANQKSVEEPTTVIGRVTVDIAWAGQREGNSKAAPVTYDVLIVDATSASPRIVAWGGAGDGPSLRPYQNAVKAALVPSAERPAGDDATTSGGER